MAKQTFKVEGLKELKKALEQFPKEAKKIARKELRKTAKEFASDLKNDFDEDTGAAKKTIKVRAAKRSRKRIGAVAIIDAPYAGNIEFGTEDIEARGSGRRSFRQHVGERQANLEKGLLNEIEKEAEKLGRNRPKV